LSFEIALFFLMFIPTKAIKFSQPACNLKYGAWLWYNVAWELPVAVQSFAMLILFLLASGLTHLWTKRKTYNAPAPG
jgi:hypothetical protein